MSDKTRQTEEQQELRDLDVPARAAQEVKGGKVSVQDVSSTQPPGKPYLAGNHNETLVRGFISANHNEALVRGYVVANHNETLVRSAYSQIAMNHNETLARKEQNDELRDLDVPEKQAEAVNGGKTKPEQTQIYINYKLEEVRVAS
jgi:hypothetical protein